MLGNSPQTDDGGAPPRLWPILGVVWLLALSSSAVVGGLSFIMRGAFDLGDASILQLQLAAGGVYVASAMGAGPVLRWLKRKIPRLSSRGVLVALIAGWGLCYIAPWVGGTVTVFAVGYVLSFALSGVVWPIIEAYVSGGRSGGPLRESIGKFNITWSSAMPVGMWGLSAAIERAPLAAMACLGALILCTVVGLLMIGAEPARHGDVSEPVRPVYHPLLTCFRTLLPLSMVLLFVIIPISQTLSERADLSPMAGMLLFSTSHVARLITFAVMRRRHGWHGRWRTVVWSMGLLFCSVALILLIHVWWVMAVALALFGMSMGMIYYAALYYGLTVGRGEVEAGGTHEALIGGGFFVGPAIALVPIWLGVAEASQMGATLAVCTVICAIATVRVVRTAGTWFSAERSTAGRGGA
ncbi:MAG: hypothetical protein KAS72_05025 [Phycisphaerales bacterium]|nr:hypothetical protein [Phycisphaerales bacterium]